MHTMKPSFTARSLAVLKINIACFLSKIISVEKFLFVTR